MFRSAEYAKWRTINIEALRLQARGKCVRGKYTLMIDAIRPDKRQRDLDNLIKPISDALVHAGVIEDDRLCERLIIAWFDEPFEGICRVRIVKCDDP